MEEINTNLADPTDLLEFADRRVLAELEQMRRKLGTEKTFALLHGALQKSDPPKTIPVGNLVEAYTSGLARENRSEHYVKTTRARLTSFVRLFPKDISAITVEDVESFLSRYLNERTRCNERTTLISLFRFAQRRGYLPMNQFTAPEQTTRPKYYAPEPAILTPWELTQLIAAARPRFLPHLILGAFCGIRTNEIQRMTWENWNPDECCFILGSSITKTSRRRVIETEPMVAEWVNYLLPKTGGLNVPIVPRGKIVQKEIYRTARRAGVPWKYNGLRHSYASYHLALHRNAARTSRNCGHSITILEGTYYQNVTQSAAAAWFSLTPSAVRSAIAKQKKERIASRRCRPFSRFLLSESTPEPTVQPT